MNTFFHAVIHAESQFLKHLLTPHFVTELKETIERVGSEFKQKIVDSIQGTWNRLYQIYSGTSSQPNINQQVDEVRLRQGNTNLLLLPLLKAMSCEDH